MLDSSGATWIRSFYQTKTLKDFQFPAIFDVKWYNIHREVPKLLLKVNRV